LDLRKISRAIGVVGGIAVVIAVVVVGEGRREWYEQAHANANASD
jgi:hypothetical protein